jgi:HAD superfamily hydrolase (TIGR01509 family)
MLSAVVFDMDGLLLDTERLAMVSWMHAASLQDGELTQEVYKGMIGLDGVGTRAHLGRHGWQDAGIAKLEAAAWAHYLAALERDGVPHKAGIFDLLDFLDERKIPRAVATSTQTPIAQHKLDRVGVGDRFDVIVGGDQVARGKPAPDIYLRAAELLGCAPAECVALEDSGYGIRAAAAAGMKVIWIPDLCEVDSATQQLVFAVAPSLSETQRVIDQLAQ